MSMDAPEGDKTHMNNKTGKKGAKKEAKKPKLGKIDGIANRVNDGSSSDVSFDLNSNTFDLNSNSSLCYDDDFDVAANFERLQKHFDQKIILLQTNFEAKVNALHEV